MNSYEAKQEAKRERLQAAAERARMRSNSAFKRADLSEAATGIPFGQPILVGHHSEKRHRKTIERANAAMSRAVDEQKRAAELDARADSVGTGGISSDDPEAVAKLREQLTAAEAKQAFMAAANKAIRKASRAGVQNPESEGWDAYVLELAQAGEGASFTIDAAARLLQPDFAGRIGFAAYQLSNNGANIRRIKSRIEQLERAATAEGKETLVDGVRVVENVDENRLQLIFPDKPSSEARRILKSCGFRWSPSEGAWQRQLNNSARWNAERALEQIRGLG